MSSAYVYPDSAAASQHSKLTHSDIEEMLLAVNGPIRGVDSDDNEYDSILALWNTQLHRAPIDNVFRVGGIENNVAWYTKAFAYWEDEANCPISDG